MSPISGSEPPLNIEEWNSRNALKESHNCFAYAMNAVDPKLVNECASPDGCKRGFHQPGYASGYTAFSKQDKKGCADMVSRLWGDNPDIYASRYESRCKQGTSKIALIVDPNRDYHFLRQDPDGYWSHKPGSMNVSRVDATNRPILRPDRASFIYTDHKDPLLYTQFCGYFCVPRGKPLYMMTNSRDEGVSSASQKPKRFQQTRRKPRDLHRL